MARRRASATSEFDDRGAGKSSASRTRAGRSDKALEKLPSKDLPVHRRRHRRLGLTDAAPMTDKLSAADPEAHEDRPQEDRGRRARRAHAEGRRPPGRSRREKAPAQKSNQEGEKVMATATARRTKKRNAAIAVAMFTLPELAKGEHYAGVLLDDKGKPAHHLVLIAGRHKLTWEDAKRLGEEAGRRAADPPRAVAPLRQRRRQVRARLVLVERAVRRRPATRGAGLQLRRPALDHTSNKFRARAVRRVPIR
jgi:hypothetical protein